MQRFTGSKIYEQLKGRRRGASISSVCSCQARWRGDSKAHAIYFYICFLSKEGRLWQKMILYGPQFGWDIDIVPHTASAAESECARKIQRLFEVLHIDLFVSGSTYRSREDQGQRLKYFTWNIWCNSRVKKWCEIQSGIINTGLTQMIHNNTLNRSLKTITYI